MFGIRHTGGRSFFLDTWEGARLERYLGTFPKRSLLPVFLSTVFALFCFCWYCLSQIFIVIHFLYFCPVYLYVICFVNVRHDFFSFFCICRPIFDGCFFGFFVFCFVLVLLLLLLLLFWFFWHSWCLIDVPYI